MSNYAVVFTPNDAVVIKQYPNSTERTSLFNVVVNPSFDKVQHVTTRYWKLDGRDIRPMTPLEARIRDFQCARSAPNHRLTTLPRAYINWLGAAQVICLAGLVLAAWELL